MHSNEVTVPKALPVLRSEGPVMGDLRDAEAKESVSSSNKRDEEMLSRSDNVAKRRELTLLCGEGEYLPKSASKAGKQEAVIARRSM